MRIGVRGHDIGKYSLDELARRIEEKDLKSIQLVMKKAITEFEITKGCMTPGLARYIKETFDRHNVNVSILGCYINMSHPDDDELKELLDLFKDHIRFARDLGCSIVGTETGALNKDYVYGPENHTEEAFRRCLNSLKVMVSEAEKFGVMVAIEGVARHVINTPKKMRRALDEINSNNLQAIFDPFNFLTNDNYMNQDEMIKEAFELYGDRIVLIHAKDFVVENGQVKQVAIGTGQFNYPLLLSLIKERKPHIDVILEGTTPEDLDSSIKYIKDIYDRV
ncbi:sugar phosphate isomerase/epimerase [Clostridium sp. HBUAS56017]|uniref:sugar phosphate isomerase/epimerase family protein n=1 Tax=Clostridium sp. HBUAS56017 TaxID=2571128 RepID=UPI0011789A15|nr:sugar phosphate isomerase/epimerase [Clostridium sp. HBUAS56017]